MFLKKAWNLVVKNIRSCSSASTLPVSWSSPGNISLGSTLPPTVSSLWNLSWVSSTSSPSCHIILVLALPTTTKFRAHLWLSEFSEFSGYSSFHVTRKAWGYLATLYSHVPLSSVFWSSPWLWPSLFLRLLCITARKVSRAPPSHPFRLPSGTQLSPWQL